HLPEMRRNGWRALQMDGSSAGYGVRLVIAPDAKLAYVIAVRGPQDSGVWRALDDAVFDELLPPRAGEVAAGATAAQMTEPRRIAGLYEPDPDSRSVVFLKASNRNLQVRATNAGLLQLSGPETATLLARNGIWTTPDGSLTASMRDGKL